MLGFLLRDAWLRLILAVWIAVALFYITPLGTPAARVFFGDHLLSLIEGTLDIARIESGKLSLNVQPLDFHDFMQQIVGMFELQARNKGLRFRYEPQGELPAWVRDSTSQAPTEITIHHTTRASNPVTHCPPARLMLPPRANHRS